MIARINNGSNDLLQGMKFLRLLLLLGFAFIGINSIAQIDTIHYLPPLYYTGNNGGDYDDHYALLSTFETTPFTVTVSTRDNSYNQSFTISKNAPARIFLGNKFNAEGLIGPADKNTVLNDEGLIFSGPKGFFVNITHLTNIQAAILTSKGSVGFGKNFYSGHMFTNMEGNNHNNNRNRRRSHFISFMATENNTYVTVENPNFTFDDKGSNSFTVVLQEGQSYVITRDFHQSGLTDVTVNHINGTNITSNKPIAVNSGSWTAGNNNSLRDIGVDQIVPIEIVGTEYIVMRGEGSNNTERVIVVSTEDNNDIYLNGSGSAYGTMSNAGDYIVIPENQYNANDILYIESDKPVYVYQSLAGSTSDATTGMMFIPRLSCNASKSVQISYADFLGNPDLKLVTQAGSVVTINGNTISGAISIPGNSYWEAYTVTQSELSGYNPGADWNFTVVSTGALNAGLTIESGAIGAGGFYSGFGTVPEISFNPVLAAQGLCAGNTELTAKGYSTYTWYKDGVEVAGESDSVYIPTGPGRYKVVGVTTCAGESSYTYPSPEIVILPCLNLTPLTLSITEGNTAQPNAEFTATLSHPWDEDDVSFNYTTVAGTASGGNDYTTSGGTNTITAGNTTKVISVPIQNDLLSENDETFELQISNAVNAVISNNSSICTIIDDTDPQPVLTLEASKTVNENAGTIAFAINLNRASGQFITTDFTITANTATQVDDFSAASYSGTLTFNPGDITKSLIININNDNLHEPGANETFSITLSNVVNATAGNLTSVCSITDNETKPVLSLNATNISEGNNFVLNGTLNNPSAKNIIFRIFTADSTATSPDDYTAIPSNFDTIPAGTVNYSLNIPTNDDIINEGLEHFKIHIQNLQHALFSDASTSKKFIAGILDNDGLPQVSVQDATTTEGTIIKFPVTISHPGSSDITFNYSTSDNTAVSPGDFTSAANVAFTISAGDMSDTIQVTTIEDTEEEGNEDLLISLSNISGNAEFSDNQAAGTIVDNDETPVAVNDAYALNEDENVSGNILSNDNGLGDPPITIPSNSDPLYGTLSLNTATGDFTYTPDANFNGTDTIQYTIRDQDGDESTARVIFTVQSVNDIPNAENDSYTMNENTALTNISVLVNDSGLGDGITVSLVADVSNGTLNLNSNGEFNYTPDNQFYGSDQFTYQITDGNGDNASATVSINVSYSNDYNPVANNDTISTPEDTDVAINVITNDSDQDGIGTIDNQSVLIQSGPLNGTLSSPANGVVTYTPDADYQGNDQFTYTFRDNGGLESNTATVYISVTADNDVPVAQCKDTVKIYLGAAGNVSITPADVDDGSHDPDGDPLTRTLSKSVFSCADKGLNIVTFTVRDPMNAQDQCTSIIQVSDTTRPYILSAPNDTTIHATPGDCGAAFHFNVPVFRDNCDGDQPGTLVQGYSSGSVFPIGTTIIKYNYTDASGNGPVEYTFEVTVEDNQVPAITCTDQNRVVNNAGSFNVSDNSLDPSVSDNCSYTLSHDYDVGGAGLNGFSLPVGTHTINWSADDGNGNISNCNQSITIYDTLMITLDADDADLIICEGDIITFTVTANGGVNQLTIEFYVNNVLQTDGVSGNNFTTGNLVDGDEVKAIVTDDISNTVEETALINVLTLPQTDSLYRNPNQ
ncbi:MAG: tandem-95 repeat protein [Bacteroidetes bacterium]|jgi:VCBS repeat-containing protein|nr:tandem-95 repeat protein [Bacteroidota bacterium]